MSVFGLFKFLLYLLPVTLVIGTNYDLFSVGGRAINIGHFDLLAFVLFFFSFFVPGKIIIPKKVFLTLIVLSSIILLSILLEIYYSNTVPSFSVFIQLFRWFEYSIIFYLIFGFLETEADIKNILYVLLGCSVIFILVATYQALTFNYFEKRIYGVFQSAADRAGESVANPNVAGTYLMGCCLFYLTYIRSTKKIIYKRVLFVLLALAIITMVMTLSRSSFIGFVLGFIVILYFYNVSPLKISLGLLIVFVTLVIAVNNIEILQYRVNVTFDSSSEEFVSITDRKERSWIALVDGFNNFWFGTGYADFERHYGFLTPDNFYAETFSDIGFLGLMSFLIFIIIVYLEISKNIHQIKDPFFKSLVVAYIAFLFAFMLANYTGNLFRNPRLLGLFFLMTALAYKYCILKFNPKEIG